MAYVKFIPVDRIPRNTYLYENRMFIENVKFHCLMVGKERIEQGKLSAPGIAGYK